MDEGRTPAGQPAARREHILVVDDEIKIVDTLKAYLEREGFAALSAGTVREAQKLLMGHPVSLVLLDLMLPDVPGEELCKRVRSGFYDEVSRDIPIIMITARADEASVIRGLNMGADDYVTKPFSPRLVVARVRAILRRRGVIQTGAPLTVGDIVIDRENRFVRRTGDGKTISLTATEFLILELLASRPHKIFTRDEIIEGLQEGFQNSGFDGFDRAIDSHIKNLRRKLGDNPRSPRYIETVYGMGYRIVAGVS